MGKIYQVGPRQSFTPLATGDYVLTLKEVGEHVEEEDSQYSKRGDVKVEWTWEVAVPNDEPTTRRVRAAVPASWNEKSTFVKIAEALRLVDHERAVTEGAHINWDVAIGKKCMGSILKLPKEGKPGEWTDNIKAFAPYQGPEDVPLGESRSEVRQAGATFMKRMHRLLLFAGIEEAIDPALSSAALGARMREIGAMAMNDAANRNLRGLLETADMVGIPMAPETWPATIKDGLLLADKVEAELEKF